MAKCSIHCPNGCDPELLVREHYRISLGVTSNVKSRPATLYSCEGCGWEAEWTLFAGISVLCEGEPELRLGLPQTRTRR